MNALNLHDAIDYRYLWLKPVNFPELILDYLNNPDGLSGFVAERVTLKNFKKTINRKEVFEAEKRFVSKATNYPI